VRQCAVFLIILMGGTGYAAQQADTATHVHDTKSFDRETGYANASAKNSARRAADIAKASRPQERPREGESPTSRKGTTGRQPVPNQTSAAANGPRSVTPSVKAWVVHPPTLTGPFGQPPNSERHRGANPATVGGTANSVVRSAGAVTGTRASRKP
jgi:hypothetical protein